MPGEMTDDYSPRLSDEVITRLATRSFTESEFRELFFRAAPTAERRPPPDDAATLDQRRTRQRRNDPVYEEARLADYRATLSLSASDDHSTQLSIIPRDSVSGEASWAAQSTMSGSTPFPHQQRLQTRLVTSEEAAQLSDMDAEHWQQASARTVARPADTAAPVVVNGSSLRGRSTPNPLVSRLQRRSVLSTPTPPDAFHASSVSAMENSTQRRRPVDAERLSRIPPY